MAGMFDDLTNQGRYSPGLGDMLKAFIPLVGPIAAGLGIRKKSKQARDRWLSENMAYTDPAELGDMGQRVQQRMLSRTGGELSVPGLIAATAAQRASKDKSNMDNPGNIVGMKAASALMQAGLPSEGLAVAGYAKENLQTPWKPSEGGTDKFINILMPDGSVRAATTPEEARQLIGAGGTVTGNTDRPTAVKVVRGKDIPGFPEGHTAGNDPFEVTYNPDGTPKNYSSLAGQRITVEAPDVSAMWGLLDKNETSNLVKEGMEHFGAYKDSERVFDELINVLEETPAGVTGWSGWVTGIGGKVANLSDFGKQMFSRVNVDGETEASVIGRWAGKISEMVKTNLPIEQQAQANALVINIAYALARMNNMGTSGGGRGITDADMKFALEQLGASTTTEAMIGVLKAERARARLRMKDRMQNLDDTVRYKSGGKAGIPERWLNELQDTGVDLTSGDAEVDEILRKHGILQ